MNKAKTIIPGASHWHVLLCADRIVEQHDVMGVSDPDPSRTEHLAGLWDAPLYQSWEEVLDVMREACLALVARRIPLAAGTATIWSNGNASFTSVNGVTETALIDVDSDPSYGPFVDQVAEQLRRGFVELPRISDLETTMSVI